MAVCAMWADSCAADEVEAGDLRRLKAVRTFADQVLKQGRDRWSGQGTPLFADGLDVRTGEPVVWVHRGRSYIISNLASQQNLLRTLVALSHLTGEDRYRDAAQATVRYHFDHLASPCGLLRWGGHQFIDLRTLRPVGDFDANCHEFKNHMPYYEFLYEINPEATARLIRAVWDAHVTDWNRLDMNRHGSYRGNRNVSASMWDRAFGNPEPFYEGQGLTFVNAGNDLIYAAAQLAALHDEPGALTWAQHMAQMYVRSRHPETGLGSYQYSKPRRTREPVWPMTQSGHTWSQYGDRAENHLGREFGEVAREGWALFHGRERSIYAIHALVMLGVAEQLGDQGGAFLKSTVEGMAAYLHHAYDEERNHFRPLWADGTDLSGRKIETYGYYNQTGKPRPFTGSDAVPFACPKTNDFGAASAA
jgi:pectate lyase